MCVPTAAAGPRRGTESATDSGALHGSGVQVLCSGCPGVEAARSPVCVAAPQLPRTMAGVTAPFHKQLMGTKLKYRYVRCPTVPRMWQVLNKQRPGGADEKQQGNCGPSTRRGKAAWSKVNHTHWRGRVTAGRKKWNRKLSHWAGVLSPCHL